MSEREKDVHRFMAFHDGELEPELRAAVRAELERDPSAQGELASLALVGKLVREVHARRAKDVDLTDSILARVRAEPPRARVEAPVSRRWERFAPAGAVLALAAMVALFVTSYRATLPEPPRVAAAPTSSPRPVVASIENLPSEAREIGVSIQSVDFGSTQGAIFMVSGGESDTMVVWTLEEGNDKG
jgi:anti-sigma factor RsiW